MLKTISLCMIVKNEENLIEQCISSVKNLADEIIIADTGSTDNTKQAAKNACKKFGMQCRLIDFEWCDDFSAARNESLKHATKDWILILDADELIESKDLIEIRKLIENAGDICGFSLEQRSYINSFFEGALENDSEFKPAREFPFYIRRNLVRLFRNGLGISFNHRVHELAEDSMTQKNLKAKKVGVILHHFGSLKDAAIIKHKTEQYSIMILKQLEENPGSARYNYQAARMYLGQNDFASALKFLGKTAKINPQYKLIFSEIAKVYLKMSDKKKAIHYFKKSMRQNPDDASCANNLAVVYMSMGKKEQAKEILENEQKKHPDNKALRYNLKILKS